MSATNLHATGLVIGTQGFLFVGPSGAGKTTAALACLADAEQRGIYAAFIGDDQVMIRPVNGRIIAEAIGSIAGQAELRGGDIVAVPSIAAAVIDFAVTPTRVDQVAPRLPAEGEQYEIGGLGVLPLLRLPLGPASALDSLLRLAAARL